MTTLGTTQKRSSWAGSCVIKHLYKTTTKQMQSLLTSFSFYPHGIIFLNKDLLLASYLLLIVLSYFLF